MGMSFKEEMLGNLPSNIQKIIIDKKRRVAVGDPIMRTMPIKKGNIIKTPKKDPRSTFMKPSTSPMKTKIQAMITQAEALKKHEVNDKIARQKAFSDILKTATNQATVPIEQRNSAVIQITADANAQMWKNVRETEVNANAHIEQVMQDVNKYVESVQDTIQGYTDFELFKQQVEETPDVITDISSRNKDAIGMQRINPLVIGAVIIGIIVLIMIIKR